MRCAEPEGFDGTGPELREEDGNGGECDSDGQCAEAALQVVGGEGKQSREGEIDGQINGEVAFTEGLKGLLGGEAMARGERGEERSHAAIFGLCGGFGVAWADRSVHEPGSEFFGEFEVGP